MASQLFALYLLVPIANGEQPTAKTQHLANKKNRAMFVARLIGA
jgi:hypothetical protein